jgi:integrase
MPELTQTKINGLIHKPGRHRLASGFFLKVLPGAKGYYVLRYRLHGKERELSLGPHPELTLAEARIKYADLYKRVKVDKVDVLAEKHGKRAATTTPTFAEIADDHLKLHAASWKSRKHEAQWEHSLTVHCLPLRSLPVDQIGTKEVIGVLAPLWTQVPETASRLRGRIETIIDVAKGLGHIDENRANPARWKGHIAKLLPNPKDLGNRHHHAAVPYKEMPALMTALRAASGVAPRALEMVILSASRASEVLRMTWNEIDMDEAVWRIPAKRMKAGIEHRVPLSDAAMAILKVQAMRRRDDNPFVLPSPVSSMAKPLTTMALTMVLQRIGYRNYTVHGFRSSFRNWAAKQGVAFEIAEECLAHAVGNAVARAYLHEDVLELRVPVMAAWSKFLAGNVVTLRVAATVGLKS